ncbi:COG0419 ATPase involved in DNA repair [Vibrio sp. B1FLJ16]|nr:COG0419 ATPase involved in DNA repair [Vibrio sp. B1FLJ16]CAE6944989.1 COG0419 ATPase involved in DNA repair [Vibrio sp. B1FLJ16]
MKRFLVSYSRQISTKKIEYALKDKASAISKAKNEFDNQIRGALQVAGVSSEEELLQQKEAVSEQLEAERKSEQASLDKLNQIKSELQKAEALSNEFARREQAEASLKLHLESTAAIHARQGQLDRAKSASKIELQYVALQNAQGQSKELAQKVTALSQNLADAANVVAAKDVELKTAKQNAEQVPQLTQSQFTLEGMKEKLIEKVDLETKVANGLQDKQQYDAKLLQYVALKDKLTHEALCGQKELEQARVDVALVPSIDSEIKQKQRLLQDVQKLAGLRQELAKHDALTTGKLQQVKHANQLYIKAQQSADLLELKWHNAQAAVLAQRLEIGEACPVCGSCEHPHPAQFTEDEVTKEQVQVERTQERDALASYNQLNNQLEQHYVVARQYQKQLDELAADLGDLAMAEVGQIQADLQSLNEKLQRLSGIDISELEKNVEQLNQRCIVGESKINELKNQMAANESTIKANQDQLNKLVANLDPKYSSLAILENEITQVKDQIKRLNDNLESAQTQLQQTVLSKSNIESQLATNKQWLTESEQKLGQAQQNWQKALDDSRFDDEASYIQSKAADQDVQAWQSEIDEFKQTQIKLEQTLNDLKLALKDLEKPNLEIINADLNTQQQLYLDARNKLDSVRSMFERIEKVRSDIENLHAKNSKLEDEYKIFGTLYDVASGKTGSRISLHRFVLGVLLDDVLIQSSQRLSLMSKGRYILARKTEGFKGAAGRGLDLVIEDGYTGKMRDVATLSGGESFMAALALALGLSDVVQSYSGGIRLDTLFIDEGFGSLDPESLDLAIQTLVDLQQTGRTIGVISHVSELKEQMAQRIDVEPSRVGSTVSVKSQLALIN